MREACPKSSSTAWMDIWWNRATCRQRRATPSKSCVAQTAAAKWARPPASTPGKNSAPTTSYPSTNLTTSVSSLNPDGACFLTPSCGCFSWGASSSPTCRSSCPISRACPAAASRRCAAHLPAHLHLPPPTARASLRSFPIRRERAGTLRAALSRTRPAAPVSASSCHSPALQTPASQISSRLLGSPLRPCASLPPHLPDSTQSAENPSHSFPTSCHEFHIHVNAVCHSAAPLPTRSVCRHARDARRANGSSTFLPQTALRERASRPLGPCILPRSGPHRQQTSRLCAWQRMQ